MTHGDQNGGAPTNTGAQSECETDQEGEKGRMAGAPRVTLLIRDRLDALERTLGTVRRRGMTLEVFSLERKGDHLALVLHACADGSVPERWIAELGALVDVKQVSVSEASDGAR